MERKVTRIGHSLELTFPQEVLEHLGIDEEFSEQINDMIHEYNQAFKGLSDR